MKKITEHLKNNKKVNLIKTAFISFVLLLSSIPLSAVADVNTNPAVTPGNIYSFDAESGLAGWQTDGLWHITTNKYNSPGHSLWYGDETTKTYNTGRANSGSLTSPPIALASGSQPVLYFWSWYQTEHNNNYDIKKVQISVNDGQWTDLKTITDTPKTWNKESVDLSNYAGNNIQIRFLFDTIDNNLNNFEGWYVDDIQVTSSATSPTPDPTPISTATSPLTTIATPNSTIPVDTNLIANPGFETGNTTPDNWVFYTNNGNTPAWDATTSHSGAESVKISVSGTTDAISGEVWSYNIPSTSGTTYTFSAWGKSQGAGGTNNPAIRLAELDKNYKWLRQTNLYFPKGNADWSKQTATVTIGADTAYVAIVADIWNGYGIFWVDDVSLSLNGSAPTSTPAPTATPDSTPAQTQDPIPTLTATPNPTPAPIPVSTPDPTPTPVSTGKAYYVAKNGNDNSPGTNAQPWLTLQKAASTAQAGDTVYVGDGVYNERLIPQNSGASNAWITFTSINPRGAVIDGSGIGGVYDWSGLVDIRKGYISVSNFEVRNAVTFAFWGGGASNINILTNYIHDAAASGIYFNGATNVVIDGNEVTKVQSWKNLPQSQIGQEIVSLLHTNYFEVKNNWIHDNYHFESINAKEGSSNGKIHHNNIQPVESAGIYMDAWDQAEHDNEIFNNVIHDGGGSTRGIALAVENGGSLKNVKVYNNIVYNNGAPGIIIAHYNSCSYCQDGQIDNIQILNNQVYHNDYAMGWGGGITDEYSAATNVIIRNNVVSQNNVDQIRITGTNGVADHNLIDGYKGSSNEINSGSNGNIAGDPQFVNPSGGDFHLKSTSPAIDIGSSSGAPAFDYDGNSRPKGAGYDIGAFESS